MKFYVKKRFGLYTLFQTKASYQKQPYMGFMGSYNAPIAVAKTMAGMSDIITRFGLTGQVDLQHVWVKGTVD